MRVSEFGVLQQFVKSSIHSRFYFCLSRRKMVNHPRRYSHLSRFLAPRRRDTTQGKQCRAHPRICLRACARACRRSYSRPSNHSTPILTSIQSQHSDTHVPSIQSQRTHTCVHPIIALGLRVRVIQPAVVSHGHERPRVWGDA